MFYQAAGPAVYSPSHAFREPIQAAYLVGQEMMQIECFDAPLNRVLAPYERREARGDDADLSVVGGQPRLGLRARLRRRRRPEGRPGEARRRRAAKRVNVGHGYAMREVGHDLTFDGGWWSGPSIDLAGGIDGPLELRSGRKRS
ncbi:MAG: hypothetical protein ACRYF1_18615 [Janthinobacterium lividum]